MIVRLEMSNWEHLADVQSGYVRPSYTLWKTDPTKRVERETELGQLECLYEYLNTKWLPKFDTGGGYTTRKMSSIVQPYSFFFFLFVFFLEGEREG